MGHELGMHVVAEGVETKEQLELLRLDGCDVAQGYLFSRALPPEELVSWLKTYRAGL
jgi:sensor c-di-GMP phosphodiesterase-like protein